jgi:hypothetical protein
MKARNTTTGWVLEQMILPALARGGYAFQTQVNVGRRLGGRQHVVDVIAEAPGGGFFPISLKWQQTGGTAEQKVPFEVMCLIDMLRSMPLIYRSAYLVLGGEGWTLREFFIGGGLRDFLIDADRVQIVTLEGFVARANQQKL